MLAHRAFVSASLDPESRSREFLTDHRRVAEEQRLAHGRHSAGRVVQRQRNVKDVVGL